MLNSVQEAETCARAEHDPGVTRVVIHRHHRFFREGLAELLDAEHNVRVVGTAATATDLFPYLDDADVVLLDFVDDVVGARVASVEIARQRPGVRALAMCATDDDARRVRDGGVAAVVPSADGLAAIVDAIRSAADVTPTTTLPRWIGEADTPSRQVLTNREA